MPSRRPPPVFPMRQLSRLVTEFNLTGVANARLLGQKKYDRGVLLVSLARQGLPDWFDGDRLRAPATITCFSSINALALSFGRPFETIRRHIRALVAEGTCVEGAHGVAIGPDPATVEHVLAYLRRTHDTMLRMVEDVAALSLLPPRTAAAASPPTRAIIGTALDLQLAPFEGMRSPLPDWTILLVWGVIGGLCVRHVTVDPGLSVRHAVDPTMDDLRRPVTLREIVAAAQLPYSSVWRHVKTLEGIGAVRTKGQGVIVTHDYLARPVIEERVGSAVEHFYRQIMGLVRQGLDPAAPMPWMEARPGLLAA